MYSMLNKLMAGVAFAAEDGTGAAAPVAPAAPAGDAAGALYPNDPAKSVAESAPNDDEGAKSGADPAAAAAWKEYEPDAAKSDEENAAAKAEHDKAKPAEAAPDALDVVPEDGKYALTMPDGVELDAGLLEKVAPQFKEMGITPRQAQKLADGFIEQQTAAAAQRDADWSHTLTKWVDDAKADPEIGGPKWDATVANSTSVVKRFGTDGLREYLNASGGGNHPEMIRFMAKVGALIGEDNPAVSPSSGRQAKPDTVSVMYPDDKPKGK